MDVHPKIFLREYLPNLFDPELQDAWQVIRENGEVPLKGRYSLTREPVKVTILSPSCVWAPFPFLFTSALVEQLAKLTETGIQVSLLVPDNALISEREERDAERNGITIVRATKQPGFPNPIDWLYFPPANLKTDVVIGIGRKLGNIAQHWKERYQCKVIQLIAPGFEFDRGIELYSSLVQVLDDDLDLEELSVSADIPVAIGPKTTDDLSASLRSEGKQVFNFTPGIINEFSNLSHGTKDGTNFRILLFGGDNPDNFQEEELKLITKTLSNLNDTSYLLYYVGAGKGTVTEERLANLFHQCGVPKRQLKVKHLPKSENEWKKLLCQVDLFIMPSGEKEFGWEAVMALSAGLPVLVHGESGFGEALKDVTFGRSAIVDSDNAEEWALRIKKVRATNKETRLEQAAMLRSNYDEKYSWEKQCRALVAMMQFIMVSDTQTADEDASSLSSDQSGSKGIKRRRTVDSSSVY